MSYLGELRDNVKPLAAACLGCGTGLPLVAYTTSAFAPHLVKEFGWSRAQFALVGLTMLTTLLILPFLGRLTDRLGVRRMAFLGTVLVPLCFVAYSLQQGSFAYFLFCSMMMLAIGSIAGPMVYTRLVAENFEQAQGLALTIVNSAPAAVAMVAVPLLNWSIVELGWRVSYLALGALALAGGTGALLLIGKPKPIPLSANATPGSRSIARDDYRVIFRSRVFWIIILGMFLCLMQTPLHASQMNIMLVDNGISTQAAANVVAVYAFGTIVGRIACGLALDRYSTRVVTAISMGIPAFGFLLLGSDLNGVGVITFAMFLVGVSVGAESDIISFLVARYFKLRIYTSTLSLLLCATFLAAAVGAGLISLTLRLTDSFSPFLYLVAGAIAIGSLLFLLLPKGRSFEKIG